MQYYCDIWGALQIQDRSPLSRLVVSRNQSQVHSDATGLNCGDRSWICNTPLDVYVKMAILVYCRLRVG